MCNCIASYNTSKTQLHKRWVVGMLRRAPCCWWGGCNETGGGGEWSEGGGCWHTLALEHWDMLLGALCTASKSCIRRFVITEKAPTRAFSWLKAATTAFSFKTLLRHYANRALTPQSLNVKLGPRRNYHKGRAAVRHSNQTACPL